MTVQNQALSIIKIQHQTYAFVVITAVVFISSLTGILTRPENLLAFFWLANAILLGIFLRVPKLNCAGGWIGAFTGYMCADLVTGNHLILTFLLTCSNMISVGFSLICIKYSRVNYLNYNKGFTFLYLFGICLFSGCLTSAAFAVSTIPHAPTTFMETDRIWIDFGMWWTGEIINYITILPIILSFPAFRKLKTAYRNLFRNNITPQQLLPFIAVVISVILTHVFFGPGALLFPLAALIWAALTYPLFVLALINSAVCLVIYNSLTSFYLSDSTDMYFATAISVRIGLCMLGLAPLILCIISSNRQELYQKVLYLANYDSLTEAMNRRYFFECSEKILQSGKPHSVSIIMLDIDHFKQMNDNYGHYTGDILLHRFASLVKSCLRSQDLFARIGGEEFVVLLMNTDTQHVHSIAERIRAVIAETPVHISEQEVVFMTVSIGISHRVNDQQTLQHLINHADDALYEAKSLGRNQVVIASSV